MFVQDLPHDPLPDTNHLNGASAPPHVTARQAQIYGDPCSHSRQGSTSPSPSALPARDWPAAHACTHCPTHIQQSMHANSHAPSGRQQYRSQAHWAHGYEKEGPGGVGPRVGVEGRSRPQSATPGGFNREGAPATAEAVHLASQVCIQESCGVRTVAGSSPGDTTQASCLQTPALPLILRP